MEIQRVMAAQPEIRVVDVGCCLGAWEGKCFQNAVLALCSGAERERLRCGFLRACGNHGRSGFGGTVEEAWNFVAVREALVGARAFVAWSRSRPGSTGAWVTL